MLGKIDCVMIRVEDPEAAASYYSEVFGLRRLWQDETSVGLGFPETDAEVVLQQSGCTVLAEPFDIPIGKCAVVRVPFGTTLSMLDMTKGPRQPLPTSKPRC